MVDMETGEGFKYPLVIVDQLLGCKDNANCHLNVIYGIICKLDPSLKANFLGLTETFKTSCPGISHLWSFLNSYVKMTRKMGQVT
ncbi:unnamed protein product [Rhizopus stolonifer]